MGKNVNLWPKGSNTRKLLYIYILSIQAKCDSIHWDDAGGILGEEEKNFGGGHLR